MEEGALHIVEVQHCYNDCDINYGHAGAGLYVVRGLIAAGPHDQGVYLVGGKDKGV